MTSSQNIMFAQLNHSRVYARGSLTSTPSHHMGSGVDGDEHVEHTFFFFCARAGHALHRQRDRPSDSL
jgi:hypothetical protein